MERLKSVGQTLKKKKWIIIAGVIALLVIAIFAVRNTLSSENNTEELTGSIETVEVRNIANSISGNGKIASVTTENVSADVTNLEVKEVLVEEGQVVEAGQVIATLDTSSLQENINGLYVDIEDAKKSQAEQDEEYNQRIEDTNTSKNERITNYYNKMVEADKNAQAAQKDYEAAVAERDTAQKNYDEYEAQLAAKKAQGQEITSTELMEESNLSTKLQTAEAKVTSTKASWDSYKSQKETYEDNLADADDEDYTSDIEDSKKDYDETVEDRIENYSDLIDDYQEQIGKAHLVASISGVITSLNVTAGSTYNGGTAATIKNLDAFLVEVDVDEYDIADVKVGQNALIKTDATRDDELTGVVTYVALTTDNTGSASSSSLDLSSLLGGSSTSSALSSLTGSSSSDSATFLVKIALDEMDDRLRIGMNARVSVLTDEADDVLALPYDALQADDDGTIYVYVVTSGESQDDEEFAYKRVNVTVGLQGTYYVEVTGEGIAEGTKVFVPADSTDTSVTDILNHVGSDAGV